MVDIIRRVTIQGRSEGLDKAAADLRNVAAAQKQVASTSQATAAIADTSSRKTLSAAAAYNRLRASLDPVYQGQQKLAAAERVLGRALDEGLISIARRNDLLALAAARYSNVAAATTSLGTAQAAVAATSGAVAKTQFQVGAAFGAQLQQYKLGQQMARQYSQAIAQGVQSQVALGGAVRNTGNQTKQLSFQLFDIAQALPTVFDSPRYALLNLATQTGQVSQLYMGQGGLRQAFADTAAMAASFGNRVKALGPTLLTFFTSPLGIAALAATGVGVAVATTVGIIVSRLPNAERAIKMHEDSIERIRKAWKDAEKGPEDYRRRATSEMQFQINQDRRIQQELLNQQIGGAFGAGAFTGGGLAAQLREELLKIQASISWTAQQKAMQDYADAIKTFLDSVDAGTPGVEKLNEQITEVANKHAGERAYQAAARALREMSAAATETVQRLKEVEQAYPDLRIGGAFEAASQPPTLSEQAARDLELARRRHGGDLFAIGAKSPGQLAQAARMREEATALSETETPESRQFRIDAAAALAYEQALHSLSEAERQREDSLNNTLELARLESDLVGKGIRDTEQLRAQTQLLQQAKQAARDAGTIVSQEEIDRITAAAAELGRLAEQQQLLALRSDILFERAQIFRSDTESRVANAMRGIYGDDYLSHMRDFEAEQIRVNERLAEFNDVGLEVTKGFLADLRGGLQEGESFFESFGEAGVNALQKISDKLFEMAIDELWSNAFGGGAGGGAGGIFGLFGRLFGGGLSSGARGLSGAGLFHTGGIVGQGSLTGRYVHPAHFNDAPRYHSGGIAGDEMPIIARRGEGVFTREQMAALGGSSGVKVEVRPTVVVPSGHTARTTAERAPDGGIDLRTVVEEATENVGRRFGLRPVPTLR